MACADGGAAHKIRLELTTAAEIFLIAPNAHQARPISNVFPVTDTWFPPELRPVWGLNETRDNSLVYLKAALFSATYVPDPSMSIANDIRNDLTNDGVMKRI
jgi:hypothetical protein